MNPVLARWVDVIANAALAGLCLTWCFIAVAHWVRSKWFPNLLGAMSGFLVMTIFLLRSLNIGGWQIPWTADAIRILWLLALVTALIYSILYLVGHNLRLRKLRLSRTEGREEK